MTRRPAGVLPRWGPVLLGAMAGLGVALGVFVIAGISRLVVGDALTLVGLFGQFLALVVAGFVAGRLAAPANVFNGGLSALLVFGVAVTISVAAGAAPGIIQLAFLGAVAAILGSAGGVLADRRRV